MSETLEHDARLSRLEAVVEGLTASVKSIETSVEKFISNNRTNWGTIFSGLTLLVVVVFAMNKGIVAPIEREVSHNEQVQTQVVERWVMPIAERQLELYQRLAALEGRQGVYHAD